LQNAQETDAQRLPALSRTHSPVWWRRGFSKQGTMYRQLTSPLARGLRRCGTTGPGVAARSPFPPACAPGLHGTAVPVWHANAAFAGKFLGYTGFPAAAFAAAAGQAMIGSAE
jgi:hypothetical protein